MRIQTRTSPPPPSNPSLSRRELKAAARQVAEQDPFLGAVHQITASNLKPTSNMAAVVTLQLGGLASGLLFAFSSLPPALSALPLAISVPAALGVRYAVRNMVGGGSSRELEKQTAEFYQRTRELQGALALQKAGTLELVDQQLDETLPLFETPGLPREIAESARSCTESCRREKDAEKKLKTLELVNGYASFAREHSHPDPEQLRRLEQATGESRQAAGVYNQLAMIHNFSLAMPFQMTMAKVFGFENVPALDLGADVRDPGVQQVLEMFQQARSAEQAPRIRVAEDHVQVGAVRLPIRRPSGS
ncbi:MAG: hypothetical protein HY319_09285 [Armatimonadetes bacterium]|nr:hypothetical protein [Armatimonadota bacterium]